jgi:orotate phosphoribosyltransferase
MPTLIQMDGETLRATLLDLICRSAYKEGDFGLTSGQRSSYYINGKQVTLHPQGALMVGRLLLAKTPAEVDAVAGLTLGADPLVTAVSLVGAYCDRILYPLIVRKEAKGHGTQAYIEGITLPPGSAIAVLEDVVTTGGSALKAVDRLTQAGYQVNHVITLVDRQEGGGDLYQSRGLNFTALYTIQDIQSRWAQLRSQAPTP